MNDKQRETAVEDSIKETVRDYLAAIMDGDTAAAEFRLRVGQLEVDILSYELEPDDQPVELNNAYTKKEFNPRHMVTTSTPKYWEQYYRDGYRKAKKDNA